ncbi:hypothetical protein B0H13DRAFT_2572206 [Mycena leptocephala]|nr:hypothetical protein B0H13DRAFT_2572206 [Mycena leptocephala]
MLPGNHNRSHKSSSSFPVTTPPPGHQRNRIACLNCRKRKVKCVTNTRDPCERCSREGWTCEYVAASNNEEMSTPSTRWVPPLDPESYARNQGIFPPPPQAQAPRAPSGYTGYGAQSAGPPGSHMAPVNQQGYSQHGYSHPSQFIPPGSSFQPGYPGNQPPAAANPAYFGTNPSPVQHGGFPEPVNPAYPWANSQPQAPYRGLEPGKLKGDASAEAM